MGKYYSAQDRLRIALERGIIVDEQDKWLLEAYTWHINHDGYPATRVPGSPPRIVLLHHCIIGCAIREGEEADHRDRNKLHNSRSNLRIVDHYTQTLNRGFPAGETGERNIVLRDTGMYKVQLYRRKQNIYLGQYPTLEEAIEIRNMWFMLDDKRTKLSELSKRLDAVKPQEN